MLKMDKLMEIIMNPPHTIKIVCLAILFFVLCLAFYHLCKHRCKPKETTFCLYPENGIEDESMDPLATSTSLNIQQKKFDPGQWCKDSLNKVAHILVLTGPPQCRPKDEISDIV